MKKVLYGTTAIIAAASFGASAQAAEPITLGVGGSMQQWFGYTNQEKDGVQEWNDLAINSDTQIEFSGETTLDNGWTVSAQIAADWVNNGRSGANGATGAAGGVHGSLDSESLTVGTPFGMITAGFRSMVGHDMHHTAPEVGMGIGDIRSWLAQPTAGWASGNGWRGTSIDDTILGGTAMVGYQTPSFGGFSIGASYAPGPGNAGGVGLVLENTSNDDAWEVTAAFDGDVSGVSVGVDVGTASGGATANSSVNAGLNIGIGALSFGGSYINVSDQQNKLIHVGSNSTDGNAWDLGAQFDAAGWNFSLTYYHEEQEGSQSDANDEEMNVFMLSAQYTLGPGVAWKTTAFSGERNGEEQAVDNNSTEAVGVVTGLSLSF